MAANPIRFFHAASYSRFSRNIQKDLKLALAFILLLTIYRFFLLFYFRGMFSPGLGLGAYAVAVINGVRYDAMVAGVFTVIPIALSLLSIFTRIERIKLRLNTFLLFFFTISAAVLLLSHFLFYLEFRHNFDHLALGFLYDDRNAVLKTAWRQYPAGKGLILDGIVSTFFICFARRFIRQPFTGRATPKKRSPLANFFLGLLWIMVYVVMLRGSLGTRPVQQKDAAVTEDIHLNSHIANPFMAMVHTIEANFKMHQASGIGVFLPNDTIDKAARRYFNNRAGQDLDALFLRPARGASQPPQHIFLIIMESMDAWNLLEKYRAFDLLPNLKALGQQGILLQNFIPASSGTMSSLSAIITGLPDAGVVTNYQPSAQKPYPTSIAPIFQQLGYKTRLFYGGYLSWQRIQDFCREQGFNEIYGGGHMGQWRGREWGVDDDVLFDFVEKSMAGPERTFDIILSTSYHSPYDIDIGQWGFPYKSYPAGFEARKANVPVTVFGHLWYTDKVLGNFIRTVQRQYPSSIFCVSGDHRSHNYVDLSSCSLYERTAVPLLLYGMGLRMNGESCRKIAGSHMDIAPTLIELAAPKGFAYHALGSDLLDPDRKQQGIGRELMITTEAIVDMHGHVSSLPFKTPPGSNGSRTEESGLELAQHIRDHYAIGWWRIMVGPALPRP